MIKKTVLFAVSLRTNPRSISRVRRSRKGAALFEFAITIPVTMLLTIATLDIARVAYFRLVVADAAGAASRYAAFNPVTDVSLQSWQQGLDQATISSVQGSPWVDPSSLVVYTPVIEQISNVEKRITVKVEYTHRVYFVWPGLPSQATVSSQVSVMAAG
ncbi:MAG: hypothetical protein RLZZ396_716 [Planctomycetota bacterium]